MPQLAVEIATLSRRLRDLHRILYDGARPGDAQLLRDLGVPVSGDDGPPALAPGAGEDALKAAVEEAEVSLNELIDQLYE